MGRRALILGAIVIFMASGCGFSKHSLVQQWCARHQRKCVKPNRVVIMAAASQCENNGRAPMPGIICRTYFFEDKNPVPVRIDGDLEFTAFDTRNPRPDGLPNGKYIVPADKLEGHYRPDLVGPSYMFWFPFEPAGATVVSVQAVFTSPSGHNLTSDVMAVDMAPAITLTHSQTPAGNFQAVREPRGSATVIERTNPKTEVTTIPRIASPRDAVPAPGGGSPQ